MSGYGSYGYDENGNQVKIFDYTLDASDNATITGYHGHLSSLYIPEEIDGYKVVGIKSAVFKNDKNLVYVSIPKTITKINVDTFTGCVNLKHVDLPDTITEICQYAFRGTAITRLDLPDSITSILTGAFRDCKQLKYLKLPKNLERLEREAFRDCKSLESVEIPKSIRYTSGNSGAVDFDGYIGPFSGCDKLTNISFEKGITTIPAYICASCWNISEIKIPDTVTKIGIYAFANCKNATKITISDSVTEIDIGAFTRCQKVENVDIPDSVSIIRKNAFDSCINLKNVKLSKYLETLGGEAFANCGKLTSIEIPKSLTTVGSVSTFGGPKGPFSECANLNNITFEKGRTKVLGFLFANCKGLKEITIPDTVKEIGPRCFEDCTNLEKVVIPNSVTSIGTRTFYNCTALKDITLPNKLTVLEANIFDSCSKLTSIKLPNTLTTISSEAFQNSGIETITIPESVTNIKSSAFESSALNSIKLNNNLVRIEDEVFKNCDKLETISIPNSVTYLGTNVFQDSDALKNVTLGTGITEIKSKAFEHCDSLEKIILPNKVTKIEDNVFLNCIALKEITIPKSVTTIANKIVSYPGKITIYGTKGSYAETYANDKNIKFVSKEVKATKVTLNKTSLSMKKGDKINLIMTVTPADYTDDIIWKSTDANIATVDNNGLVTAKKAGTSTISVTIVKVSANCKITVTDESQAQYPLQSISLNKTSSSITVGETDTLKVTYNPTNTTDNKQVNWTSSNTGVATVSTSGVITAKKEGTATITAKVGTKTATCKVTVKAKETTPTTPTNPIQEDDTLPFKDVPQDSWYYDAVKYAYKNKYIAGYNSTTFAPFDKLSRGQLVTILWRIEGQPDTSKLQNKFTDVDEGVYYTEPIKWANSVGIVKGYGGTTKFGPGDPIIRQDLCIVLNKYAAYKKKSATGTSSLSNFIDYKTVSGYAENAVKWAVENSIVSGNALPDGTKTIAPMANATRCEVAVMLMRYCNKFN